MDAEVFEEDVKNEQENENEAAVEKTLAVTMGAKMITGPAFLILT